MSQVEADLTILAWQWVGLFSLVLLLGFLVSARRAKTTAKTGSRHTVGKAYQSMRTRPYVRARDNHLEEGCYDYRTQQAWRKN